MTVVADRCVDVVDEELPTNAALEFLREGVRRRNESRSIPPGTADDVRFEDRRTGANFGRQDGRGWASLVDSVHDVAPGQPHWSISDVVGVRGQRCAAFVLVVDFGNGMFTDHISCCRLTPELDKVERNTLFDVDARDEAIAELDRLHAETGG